MSKPYTFTSAKAQRAIDRILTVLNEGTKTRAQIAATTFLSPAAVTEYVKHLHAAKRIYIAAWGERSGWNRPAFFAAGNRPDAKMPPAKTGAQQSKETRRRIKADPVRLMHYQAKAVIRERRRRPMRVKVDPLTAWIPRREHREAA